MTTFKSIALTALFAIPLAMTATVPPAEAGDAASALLAIAFGVLVGTSAAPQPQQAPQLPQPQQPMRWIDQQCLPNPDTTVCRSPLLRSMVQHNSELVAAYLSRLSGPATDQARAELRQRTAQYHEECGAAPVDQKCIYKWEYYWDQLYSARLAALSAQAPARLRFGAADCRTVLADWQTKYFFRLHPSLTYDQGVAMVNQCAPRQRPVTPTSYPPPTPPSRDVRIAGEITEATIAQFDASILRDPNINTVVLDSPGGRVIAGRDLAMRIRRLHLTTVVPANAECASACFMLFAAGEHRIASTSAKIGVHSASLDGEENRDTLAVSTLMARQCAIFGVPDHIVGKMVTTEAADVDWLTAADLRSMQVDVQ